MTDQVNEAVAWMTPEAIAHLAKQSGPAKVDAWNCASGSDRVPVYTHPARGVVDEALEWLDTEVSATSTRYHGDPRYDHDAYWMKQKVFDLIRECREIFAAQAAQPAVPSVPEVCEWTFDDDEHAPMWTSPCGVTYSFTEGGPEDNGHKFCHSCGKPMLAATSKDQPVRGVG